MLKLEESENKNLKIQLDSLKNEDEYLDDLSNQINNKNVY